MRQHVWKGCDACVNEWVDVMPEELTRQQLMLLTFVLCCFRSDTSPRRRAFPLKACSTTPPRPLASFCVTTQTAATPSGGLRLVLTCGKMLTLNTRGLVGHRIWCWSLRRNNATDAVRNRKVSLAGAATSVIFAKTKVLSWRTCLLWQILFCRNKTRLLWQQMYACCDKTFVVTNICRNKTFVVTNICSDKYNFVTTSLILLWQTCVCRDKNILSW